MVTRLRVSPNVVFRVLDGEAVLLHLDTGTYFTLNPTGTRIWELIEREGDPERVREIMRSEYDVSPDALDADIRGLVEQLLDKGLAVADDSR